MRPSCHLTLILFFHSNFWSNHFLFRPALLCDETEFMKPVTVSDPLLPLRTFSDFFWYTSVSLCASELISRKCTQKYKLQIKSLATQKDIQMHRDQKRDGKDMDCNIMPVHTAHGKTKNISTLSFQSLLQIRTTSLVNCPRLKSNPNQVNLGHQTNEHEEASFGLWPVRTLLLLHF